MELHRPDLLTRSAGVNPMRAVICIDGTWLFHRMLALHGKRTGVSISEFSMQDMLKAFN